MEDGFHVIPTSRAGSSCYYFSYPYHPAHAVICSKLSAIPIKSTASTWCVSEMIQEDASERMALLVLSLQNNQSMPRGFLR